MEYKYIKNIKIWYAIILFLLYMLICFIMPTIINGEFNNKNTDVKNENELVFNNKIKLLLKESNTVVEIDLEDYIKGVLIGEMPVTYEIEALKAQAVVARTYTLFKIRNATKHEFDADMCDDINCCQAYKTKEYALASWDDSGENEKWAKLESAVTSTSGETITYNGELINAFFHANSGGKTENIKYLWSKAEVPYLISVDGKEKEFRQETKTFSKEEFKNLINSLVHNYNNNSTITILDYTESGRVNTLNIDGIIIEASTLRNLTGIKSTNFKIEESGDAILFHTVGYGHGVGMSQDGANQMALEGNDYISIIKHYYTGVEVQKNIY